MISITAPYMLVMMALGILSHQERIFILNPAQACLQVHFAAYLFLYSIEQFTPFFHANQASLGKNSHSSLTCEVNKIK